MTDSTTRPPRTHAALSLAVDGRWTGDRESLRRQLAVVEAEAAEIENRRWLEQSAIAERSRAEAAAPDAGLREAIYLLGEATRRVLRLVEYDTIRAALAAHPAPAYKVGSDDPE